MQNKKKVSGKKSGELTSPKFTRLQKKASENLHVQEEKVTKLITSSARKQRSARNLLKNTEECVAATNLDTTFGLVEDETGAVCLNHGDGHVSNGALTNSKVYDSGAVHRVVETIFSPAFHISRSVGAEIANGACRPEFLKFFPHGGQHFEEHGKENLRVDLLKENFMKEMNFNVETSMNLACPGFGAFRPVLLPKQTRSCPSTTLVLDLDETLVHSTLEHCDDADFTFSVNFNLKEHTVCVRCRPHLRDFMDRVSGLFEIIIFTASQSIYAEQLLNVLDPKRKVFRHRVYRESCVCVDGNYLKDLSVLGRDLAHVIIIDNSPQVFGFQIDNGIPIESWFDDRSDKELLALLPFLESLVGVEDVRPLIAKKFNLREKIAAAACPFSSNGRDPLER